MIEWWVALGLALFLSLSSLFPSMAGAPAAGGIREALATRNITAQAVELRIIADPFLELPFKRMQRLELHLKELSIPANGQALSLQAVDVATGPLALVDRGGRSELAAPTPCEASLLVSYGAINAAIARRAESFREDLGILGGPVRLSGMVLRGDRGRVHADASLFMERSGTQLPLTASGNLQPQGRQLRLANLNFTVRGLNIPSSFLERVVSRRLPALLDLDQLPMLDSSWSIRSAGVEAEGLRLVIGGQLRRLPGN